MALKEAISEVEATLVRRIDWRILPFVSWLYLLSYLDRSNISNVHDDLLDDLNISESQYSLAVSVFYIGYIIFEIPSNMVLKRVSPSFWIGTIVVAWGICSTAMIFVTEYWHLVLIRTFLGVAEAGFFPGVIFYLTFWYRRQEQGFRFALFYCSSALAGAFGGLLAFGILQLENVGPFKDWQWLFLFEGVPSIISGIVTWFYLPTYPAEVAWLSPAEREMAVERLTHLKTTKDTKKISSKALLKTLVSPKIWGFMIIFFCIVTPAYAVSFFLPAILGEFYDTLTANLLTTPVWFVAAVVIIGNAYHSDRTGERAYHVIIPSLIAAVGFVGVGIATSPIMYSFALAYTSMFFVASGVTSLIPITLAWLTNYIKGTTKIGTATAMVVGFGNLGGIVGPNLYGFLYIPATNGTEASAAMGYNGQPILSASAENGGTYYLAHLTNAGIMVACAVVAYLVKRFAHDDIEDEESDTSDGLVVNRNSIGDDSGLPDEKTALLST